VLGLVAELKARQAQLDEEVGRSRAAQEEKEKLSAKLAEQQAQLETKQAELNHEKTQLHRRTRELELRRATDANLEEMHPTNLNSTDMDRKRRLLGATVEKLRAEKSELGTQLKERRAELHTLAKHAANRGNATGNEATLMATIAALSASLNATEERQRKTEEDRTQLALALEESQNSMSEVSGQHQKEFFLEREWENDKVEDLRSRVRELKAAQLARQDEYNATLSKANDEKAAQMAQIRTLVEKLNEKHTLLKSQGPGTKERKATQEASDEKVERLKEAEQAHEASLKKFEMLKDLTGRAAAQHEEQLAGLQRQIDELEVAQAEKERDFNATLTEAAAPIRGNLSVAKLARAHAEQHARRMKKHMVEKNDMLHKMRSELNAKEASLARAEFDLSKNDQALKEGARVLAEGELKLAENEQKFIDMRDEQRHLIADGPLGRAQNATIEAAAFASMLAGDQKALLENRKNTSGMHTLAANELAAAARERAEAAGLVEQAQKQAKEAAAAKQEAAAMLAQHKLDQNELNAEKQKLRNAVVRVADVERLAREKAAVESGGGAKVAAAEQEAKISAAEAEKLRRELSEREQALKDAESRARTAESLRGEAELALAAKDNLLLRKQEHVERMINRTKAMREEASEKIDLLKDEQEQGGVASADLALRKRAATDKLASEQAAETQTAEALLQEALQQTSKELNHSVGQTAYQHKQVEELRAQLKSLQSKHEKDQSEMERSWREKLEHVATESKSAQERQVQIERKTLEMDRDLVDYMKARLTQADTDDALAVIPRSLKKHFEELDFTAGRQRAAAEAHKAVEEGKASWSDGSAAAVRKLVKSMEAEERKAKAAESAVQEKLEDAMSPSGEAGLTAATTDAIATAIQHSDAAEQLAAAVGGNRSHTKSEALQLDLVEKQKALERLRTQIAEHRSKRASDAASAPSNLTNTIAKAAAAVPAAPSAVVFEEDKFKDKVALVDAKAASIDQAEASAQAAQAAAEAELKAATEARAAAAAEVKAAADVKAAAEAESNAARAEAEAEAKVAAEAKVTTALAPAVATMPAAVALAAPAAAPVVPAAVAAAPAVMAAAAWAPVVAAVAAPVPAFTPESTTTMSVLKAAAEMRAQAANLTSGLALEAQAQAAVAPAPMTAPAVAVAAALAAEPVLVTPPPAMDFVLPPEIAAAVAAVGGATPDMAEKLRLLNQTISNLFPLAHRASLARADKAAAQLSLWQSGSASELIARDNNGGDNDNEQLLRHLLGQSKRKAKRSPALVAAALARKESRTEEKAEQKMKMEVIANLVSNGDPVKKKAALAAYSGMAAQTQHADASEADDEALLAQEEEEEEEAGLGEVELKAKTPRTAGSMMAAGRMAGARAANLMQTRGAPSLKEEEEMKKSAIGNLWAQLAKQGKLPKPPEELLPGATDMHSTSAAAPAHKFSERVMSTANAVNGLQRKAMAALEVARAAGLDVTFQEQAQRRAIETLHNAFPLAAPFDKVAAQQAAIAPQASAGGGGLGFKVGDGMAGLDMDHDMGQTMNAVYNLLTQLDGASRLKYAKNKVAEALTIEREALKQLRGAFVGGGEAKPFLKEAKQHQGIAVRALLDMGLTNDDGTPLLTGTGGGQQGEQQSIAEVLRPQTIAEAVAPAVPAAAATSVAATAAIPTTIVHHEVDLRMVVPSPVPSPAPVEVVPSPAPAPAEVFPPAGLPASIAANLAAGVGPIEDQAASAAIATAAAFQQQQQQQAAQQQQQQAAPMNLTTAMPLPVLAPAPAPEPANYALNTGPHNSSEYHHLPADSSQLSELEAAEARLAAAKRAASEAEVAARLKVETAARAATEAEASSKAKVEVATKIAEANNAAAKAEAEANLKVEMARKVASEAELASSAKVRAAKDAVIAAEAARDATSPTAKMAAAAAATTADAAAIAAKQAPLLQQQQAAAVLAGPVSGLVLEAAREMKEAMRAVRSTVSLRLSMETAMLAQGEAVASLQETYGAANLLADEPKEDAASQDEAARGLTAGLVEACKDKSSSACKASLEERRKFGLNQLASVKGHQLKALIKLESAVTAGDQLAVNVLSKQLAAINQRSASEQQAESSFNFVPEQVFVAAAPQLLQVAAPPAAAAAAAQNATVAVVANATGEAPPAAAANASAAVVTAPVVTAPVVTAQVQQVLHEAQKAAEQQHEQQQALEKAPGLVQNASSFQELAVPLGLGRVSEVALAKVADGAKQEWKADRQAWESKWESRINALMKHEKDMQNDLVARDLKGENEAKSRAAKEKVEAAAKEKMHEKMLADRAAQSKVEATKEAAKVAREAAAKAKEEMAKVADAQMAKVEAATARGVQAAKDEMAKVQAEKAKVEAMKASLQSHLSQVAGAAPPAQQQAPAQAAQAAPSTAPRRDEAMPKDFLAAPVAPVAPAVQGATAARPAQVSAAVEAMRGALGGFRDAMGTGHAELDETWHAQHSALVALLRAYPLVGGEKAGEEMAAVQLLQPPVAPEQQQQQGGQEGMLSGLQRIEEAKLLSRKAEAALVLVGGGSANALQLQRNTLESLDAAEQMQELEMQKEALELEEKESQLLKESP